VIVVDSDGGRYTHCGREGRGSDLKFRGTIFHDLRRRAVRGLVRAGVSQKTAILITGRKTVSTFHRCQIVLPADKQDAAGKLESSQAEERKLWKNPQAPAFGPEFGQTCTKSRKLAQIGIPAERPPTPP
jgi:hypothetical protein